MKRYILLLILLVSCTSYNDDYEAETIMKYKNIYTEFEIFLTDRWKINLN